MTFSTHDMQSTGSDHFVVLFFALFAKLGQSNFVGSGIFIALGLVTSQVFGITAQNNVSSPTSHVGGNGHGTFAPRLGDDFRFLFVVFGVQDRVLDTQALHHAGENF